jgi:hypothetical protein
MAKIIYNPDVFVNLNMFCAIDRDPADALRNKDTMRGMIGSRQFSD